MYRFLVSWTNPYTSLLVLITAVLAYLILRRKAPRRALLLVAVPWMLVVTISLPFVGHFLLGTMEWDYPPRRDWPDDVDAIVVLSGGSLAPDSVRLRAILTGDSLYRCLHTAEVYRFYAPSRPIPVIASGGKVVAETPGPTLSELMRDFLLEVGVPSDQIVLEDRSSTTHENAVESAKLLRERGLGKVVLVTDAVHMGRARRCFRKAGLEVVPSACDHTATELRAPYYRYAIPNPGTVQDVDRVLHEWLGFAWYWLRGYL